MEEGLLRLQDEVNQFLHSNELDGEVVLMAMLMGDVIEGEFPELPLKLITLNERHFNLFEYDERFNRGNELPTIKLKSSVVGG